MNSVVVSMDGEMFRSHAVEFEKWMVAIS